MSYILGALKKAEKDRKRDRSLDLDDWDQETWQSPEASGSPKNAILWLVSVTLIVVLILFVWLAYKIILATPSQSVEPQQIVIQQIMPPAEVSSKSIEVSKANEIVEVVESRAVPVVIQSQEVTSVEPKVETTVQASAPRPLPAFSGSIYFPSNSELSRVFSGANAFREAEVVGGYRIEKIFEKEVLLSLSGETFTVRFE